MQEAERIPVGASTRLADYYAIMGLQPEATGAMVDEAYWRSAPRLQAAATADPDATTKLDRLNEAYSVLGSPLSREEYDKARNGPTSAPARSGVRATEAAGIPAWWRSGLESESMVRKIVQGGVSLWARMGQYQLGATHALVATSVLVMLVLAILAWAAGADSAPVGAMLILGVCVAALVLLVPRGTTGASAPGEVRPRRERPHNLGGLSIPGGRSSAVRHLVYELYDKCPHLGPAQVASTARYALLTQKFIWFERLQRERAETISDEDLRHLMKEQRELAAELRQHEKALGIAGDGQRPLRREGGSCPEEDGADAAMRPMAVSE